MDFTTTTSNVFFYGEPAIFPSGDFTMVCLDVSGSLTVHWGVQIEARKWGIKDISAIVFKVAGEVECIADMEDIPEHLDNSLRDDGWDVSNARAVKILDVEKMGLELKDELKVAEGGSCVPTEIEIDFRAKTITVK